MKAMFCTCVVVLLATPSVAQDLPPLALKGTQEAYRAVAEHMMRSRDAVAECSKYQRIDATPAEPATLTAEISACVEQSKKPVAEAQRKAEALKRQLNRAIGRSSRDEILALKKQIADAKAAKPEVPLSAMAWPDSVESAGIGRILYGAQCRAKVLSSGPDSFIAICPPPPGVDPIRIIVLAKDVKAKRPDGFVMLEMYLEVLEKKEDHLIVRPVNLAKWFPSVADNEERIRESVLNPPGSREQLKQQTPKTAKKRKEMTVLDGVKAMIDGPENPAFGK